jgi:antirestriction protein ArdC
VLQIRLGRFSGKELQGFGSEEYSKEELVAEMGAALLWGLTGIETATIENQAAYLQGWINVLRGDSKLLVQAGGKAQKAVDLITGESLEQAPDDENAAA